jgi:hypothetical protein
MIDYFSDRSNVTHWIAIISFCISIYNFLTEHFRYRLRLKVEVSHIFHGDTPDRGFDVVNLRILNPSARPVVISRIEVSNYLRAGAIGSYRKQIYTKTVKTNGVVVSKTIWTSDQLPIKIEANGCVNLLLVTDANTPLFLRYAENYIRVYTSGKIQKLTHRLSNFSDTKLLEVCREPDCQ